MGISPKLLPPGKMHSQGNHLIHSAIVSPCRQHSKPAQRTNLHQHCSQRCCPPVVSLDQHLHVPCMDTSSISWGVRALTAPTQPPGPAAAAHLLSSQVSQGGLCTEELMLGASWKSHWEEEAASAQKLRSKHFCAGRRG